MTEAEEMNNIKSGCVNGIWMCTIVYETLSMNSHSYNSEPTRNNGTPNKKEHVNAHLLNSINNRAQTSNSSSNRRSSSTSFYWIVQFHHSQISDDVTNSISNHTFYEHLEHKHTHTHHIGILEWEQKKGNSGSSNWYSNFIVYTSYMRWHAEWVRERVRGESFEWYKFNGKWIDHYTLKHAVQWIHSLPQSDR